MCYSAEAWHDYRKFKREFGANISIKQYVRLFWDWKTKGSPYRILKAMQDAFANATDGEERQIRDWIEEWKTQQTTEIEKELFALKKRLADAERSLQTKVTKKAQNDQRIATDKISKAMLRLADLRRTDPLPRDSRFFPGNYATVMVSEGGQRVVYPMRYGCRPAGKPSFYDTKFPGTYNARRDKLEGFWNELFGHTHALMVVETFYENVEGADGKNKVLQFRQKDGGVMFIACLWSHWTDPKGKEPDLFSFAAITDDPEPEVAAAGHDRTIINIKPEHIDAWLNPDPKNLAALYAIFDDKQHPYYEHREAA
jgi:putative SOS response-associated peptidase YedK